MKQQHAQPLDQRSAQHDGGRREGPHHHTTAPRQPHAATTWRAKPDVSTWRPFQRKPTTTPSRPAGAL